MTVIDLFPVEILETDEGVTFAFWNENWVHVFDVKVGQCLMTPIGDCRGCAKGHMCENQQLHTLPLRTLS